MFYLKSCKKCKGDLYVDQDQYGSFLECVQCGSIWDLELKDTFKGYTDIDELSKASVPLPISA